MLWLWWKVLSYDKFNKFKKTTDTVKYFLIYFTFTDKKFIFSIEPSIND